MGETVVKFKKLLGSSFSCCCLLSFILCLNVFISNFTTFTGLGSIRLCPRTDCVVILPEEPTRSGFPKGIQSEQFKLAPGADLQSWTSELKKQRPPAQMALFGRPRAWRVWNWLDGATVTQSFLVTYAWAAVRLRKKATPNIEFLHKWLTSTTP